MKAKTHTEKVQTTVQTLKEKEAKDLLARSQDLIQKLKDAQSRKDIVTKQKVQTAQMFQAKRSPSKEMSPKKEE